MPTEAPLTLICDEPWKKPAIKANGDVVPCCKSNEVMGNLNEASFKEIWYGGRFQKFRRNLLAARVCRHCVKWSSRSILPALDIWKAGSYPGEAPFGLGWYGIEAHRNRKWRCTGRKAVLFLLRSSGRARLRIKYFGLSDSAVTVLLNGEAVGSFTASPGKRKTADIDIGTCSNHELATVGLCVSRTITTPRDRRHRGIGVEEMGIYHEDAAPGATAPLTRFDSYLDSMCDSSIPLPTMMLVELTTRCNYSCAMCFKSVSDRKGDRDMDFELYRRLASEIFDSLDTAILSHLGESLLHPRFAEMLFISKEHGLRADVVTNASLIDDRMARVLVEGGMGGIQVSIDGLRDTYNRLRRGGDFDAVIRNLKTLARVKKELLSERPYIYIEFVAMKSNIAELPDLVELLCREDIGIRKFDILQLAEYPHVKKESLIGNEELARDSYRRALKIARSYGTDMELIPPYQWGDDFHPESKAGLARVIQKPAKILHWITAHAT